MFELCLAPQRRGSGCRTVSKWKVWKTRVWTPVCCGTYEPGVHLLYAAAHTDSPLLQLPAVLVHVLDGLDDALRALPHLPDGVGGVDQVPVALSHHLPQLLFLLLDLRADFALDLADLIGVVALEEIQRVLDLRDPERQRRTLGHRSSATTSDPVVGAPTRKTGWETLPAST